MQRQEKSQPSVWERIPRSFWYSVVFMGVYAAIYLVASEDWMKFSQLSSLSSQLVQNVGSIFVVSSVLTVLLSLVGIRKYRRKREERSADLSLQRLFHVWLPLLFSTSLLLVSLGNIINAYNYAHNIFAIPSWADIAVLASFPLQIIGILLLPMRSLPGRARRRIMLDSLMVVAALVTFSWYFLLGPLLLNGTERSVLAIATNLAFPCLTLLLTSCLILFTVFTPRGSGRLTVGLLCVGVAISTVAGTIHQYNELHSGPLPFTWIALGWMLGGFLIALAVQSMHWLPVGESTSKEPAQDKQTVPMWWALLPYLLIPAVLGLVLYVWETDRSSPLALGTYICSLLLLVLIFGKQIIVIREIHWLNGGLQAVQHTLQQANARLEAMATTDPLTELPNHRALVSMLDQELARCKQYQRRCSVLFFDLDHFKALNDSYGHAGGDTALQEFGSLVRATLPAINTVGRWGGEEFVVLLPEQGATQASEIAEQLRSTVSSHSFSIGGGMHLTCSIGVASYPAHAQQRETLLLAADSAMYGAKRLGRNQIRVIDDPAVRALLATSSEVEGRDEAALIGTVHALALLVDQRDAQTGKHSQHVGELLLRLAQSLGFSSAEASQLSLVGQLHDIGKIVVADQILNKQEPLTESELTSLRRHSQVGADVVSCIPSLRPLAPIIHAHHEQWDGTGYPDQLAGETIPFGARLLAVVDAYAVMTDGRSYQPAVSPREALEKLQHRAGTQFDPQAVEALTRLVHDAPEHRAEYESGTAASGVLV